MAVWGDEVEKRSQESGCVLHAMADLGAISSTL